MKHRISILGDAQTIAKLLLDNNENWNFEEHIFRMSESKYKAVCLSLMQEPSIPPRLFNVGVEFSDSVEEQDTQTIHA